MIAWSAGARKSVAPDAHIGVHGTLTNGGMIFENSLNAVMAKALSERGAPSSVVAAIVTVPSTSIYWLTPADLAAWNVKVTY